MNLRDQLRVSAITPQSVKTDPSLTRNGRLLVNLRDVSALIVVDCAEQDLELRRVERNVQALERFVHLVDVELAVFASVHGVERGVNVVDRMARDACADSKVDAKCQSW